MPRTGIRFVVLSTLLLLAATSAFAGERLYMKKNETFCDSNGVLCLRGSLTYRVNSRIVSLNARVQKQTGPGVIHITLAGTNRQGMLRRTEIIITIRGTHSEIIDHQMVPGAPDVYEWAISSFLFEAKSE